MRLNESHVTPCDLGLVLQLALRWHSPRILVAIEGVPSRVSTGNWTGTTACYSNRWG